MNGPDPDVKPSIGIGTSMSELRKSLAVDFQAGDVAKATGAGRSRRPRNPVNGFTG